MGKIDYKYLNLTFISSKEEIERQIINTSIFSFIETKFNNVIELSELLESTQYGYNAPGLDSGQNKFLRISDIKEGKVNWETVPFCNCTDEKSYVLYSNDILVARTGGTTGKSFLIESVPKSAVFAGYLIRLRTNKKILPEFLNLFLNSYAYWSQISEMKSGSAQPNVNAEKLKKLLIPYCSIEYQKDILELIIKKSTSNNILKELSKKIDSVKEQYYKCNELTNLFQHQSELIKKLRQSILQDAVQGKFSSPSGWSNREDAHQILQKIKAEKQKLIAEVKHKKEKELPSISPDEVPFELPKGWVWCRYYDVATLQHGYQFRDYDFVSEGIPVIKITQCKSDGTLDLSKCDFIDEKREKEFSDILIKQGDLLMALTGGTLGKVTKVKHDYGVAVQNYRVGKFLANEKVISLDYLTIVLKSDLFQSLVKERINQNAQPNIGKDDIEKILIPLPPISLQEYIVAKVEELMQACEALEEEVEQSKTQLHHLRQSVLREAFEGN